MDEFVVYILYSEPFDTYYTGYTSHLIQRFEYHNKLATKGYTSRYRPWKVLYLEYFTKKNEAIDRERFLKSGKGRQLIKPIIEKLKY